MAQVKTYTREEVAKHCTSEDCWIILGNASTGGAKVYNVTDYLDFHPGDADVILDFAGQDAHEAFEDIGHSDEAREEFKKFYIGDLADEGETKKAEETKQPTEETKEVTEELQKLSITQEQDGIKYITMDEVQKHNTSQSCWIIIGNDSNGGPKVYDVTKYLDYHPGDADVLLDVAGQNGDEGFEDIGHSQEAREEMKKYYVGHLKVDEAAIDKMKSQKNAKGKKSWWNPFGG